MTSKLNNPWHLNTLSAVLIGAVACSGDPDGGAEVSQAGHVALAPTPANELPAAVLGTAPAPQGEAVRYVEGDSATIGYLSVPRGDGPFPAVILIHEWNGLVDRIRQMADAMAAEGYVALAADLYRGRTGATREDNMALVQETRSNSAGIIANLDAAAQYLRNRPDVTGRVAAMGWCFGGGIALSYGLGGARHDGTAIFYGSLLVDPDSLRALSHEVYGTFAELDAGIPPDEVDRFAQALEAIGVPHDIHVYDDVNHGFWLRVDGDQATREAPALDAWQRLKAYLRRALTD